MPVPSHIPVSLYDTHTDGSDMLNNGSTQRECDVRSQNSDTIQVLFEEFRQRILVDIKQDIASSMQNALEAALERTLQNHTRLSPSLCDVESGRPKAAH